MELRWNNSQIQLHIFRNFIDLFCSFLFIPTSPCRMRLSIGVRERLLNQNSQQYHNVACPDGTDEINEEAAHWYFVRWSCPPDQRAPYPPRGGKAEGDTTTEWPNNFPDPRRQVFQIRTSFSELVCYTVGNMSDTLIYKWKNKIPELKIDNQGLASILDYSLRYHLPF